MAGKLTEPEVLAVLRAIEQGEIKLKAKEGTIPFAGNCGYLADNGWKLEVFVDCGDWDYLDWAKAPDGREIHFEDFECAGELFNYGPDAKIARTAYGFPAGNWGLSNPWAGNW